jgi:hypothetical protein
MPEDLARSAVTFAKARRFAGATRGPGHCTHRREAAHGATIRNVKTALKPPRLGRTGIKVALPAQRDHQRRDVGRAGSFAVGEVVGRWAGRASTFETVLISTT